MAYVEGQTVHDADSHVMELPGTINRYLDPKFRDAFVQDRPRDESPHWSTKAQAARRRRVRRGAEANILLRKNYEAPRRLPLMTGRRRSTTRFTSQLVFTTACLSNFGLSRRARWSSPWRPRGPTTA
jgi:hypothetical protein